MLAGMTQYMGLPIRLKRTRTLVFSRQTKRLQAQVKTDYSRNRVDQDSLQLFVIAAMRSGTRYPSVHSYRQIQKAIMIRHTNGNRRLPRVTHLRRPNRKLSRQTPMTPRTE